ncbi:MAG TPA: MarR family transcriptional regulator [Verrucomicrobiae bacterium]|jgi:DNA-binding MarR family transcriptional regulator|nr:MarR family transcriptional regulator [Verrucomicrobiae bacterium]
MSSVETDVTTLEDAMRLFFQTMKRPHHWARVTKRAGVSVDRPAAVILHTLMANQAGHCRVHDLAAQLGIEAPSVTRKTQELEQAGYLRRVPDPLDGRAISLQVTPRGRTIGDRLWKAQREIISQALTGWEAAERQQFVELFQRFSNDLAGASATDKQQLHTEGKR